MFAYSRAQMPWYHRATPSRPRSDGAGQSFYSPEPPLQSAHWWSYQAHCPLVARDGCAGRGRLSERRALCTKPVPGPDNEKKLQKELWYYDLIVCKSYSKALDSYLIARFVAGCFFLINMQKINRATKRREILYNKPMRSHLKSDVIGYNKTTRIKHADALNCDSKKHFFTYCSLTLFMWTRISRPGRRLSRVHPCWVPATDLLTAWGFRDKRTTRPSFFTSSMRLNTYWPTFRSEINKTLNINVI